MRYALTGHTSGIGKTIFERLYPSVIGFSRSTGYDINYKKDRQKIIQESFDCDIFINNACDGFGQTILFLELHKEWQFNPNKTIINVGSRIADIKFLPPNREHLIFYQAQKVLLKEMHYRVTGKCLLKYKSFGYVGTKKILEKYPNLSKNEYITEDAAVDIILL